MKGRTCPKEVTCSIAKTFHVLIFYLLKRKSRKVLRHLLLPFICSSHSHGVPPDLTIASVSRFQQPQKKPQWWSYTCTDGTLLLRTCALISWTLVMIFFWWPMSVTPSLWMSLNHRHTYKNRMKSYTHCL